jgi:hypothetical protein
LHGVGNGAEHRFAEGALIRGLDVPQNRKGTIRLPSVSGHGAINGRVTPLAAIRLGTHRALL